MTAKDITILLSPTIIFATVAVCAFIFSRSIQREHDIQQEREHQQKFDAFVTNVESGKWQIPPDRWIMILSSAEKSAASYQAADASTGKEVQDFVWLSAIGVYWQVAAVFIVRKRLKKT